MSSTPLEGFDCAQHQDKTPIRAGDAFGFARATLGNVADTKYAWHTANIKKAGLVPGGYLFLMGPKRGVPVELQVGKFAEVSEPGLAALDWEQDTYLNQDFGHQPFSGVLAGIDAGRTHEINFGVYASLSNFTGSVISALKAKKVPFLWVAYWSGNLPASILNCGIPIIQQYLGGPDRDRFYGTLADLQALAGAGSQPPAAAPAPFKATNLVPLTCHRVVDLQPGVVLSASGKPYSTVGVGGATLGMLGAVNAEWYHVASGDAGVYVRRGDAVVRTADINVGA